MFQLLTLLMEFMVIAAIVAVWTDDLLSAVIAVGAVGFGSSVAFLLLGAPDVALTQIVVEVLTLVILIRATVRADVQTATGTRDMFGLAVAGALLLLLVVFSVGALGTLPPFGVPAVSRVADAPAATYMAQGLSKTGAGNLVTAVLLDFRGYDTLGEATVLFAAVLGAMALLRRKSHVEDTEST
jgi:multisubunit Na+/H+ antiporter MnhB subunit